MSTGMTPEELEKFIHRELRALPARKAPAGLEARLQAALDAKAGKPVRATQWEDSLHRELKALPLRQAPRTLEARVLAEIERRSAIAWYHKSWSYWPAAVRASFLALATGISGAAVLAFFMMSRTPQLSQAASAAGERFSFLTTLYQAGVWTVDLGSHLLGTIPSVWLYGAAATVFLLYFTFLGLGATAYRVFIRAK